MTPEQFTYWIQGFVELNDGKMPTPEQWQSIQDHLKTVFRKITPPFRPLGIGGEIFDKQQTYCQQEAFYKDGNFPLNWEVIPISC